MQYLQRMLFLVPASLGQISDLIRTLVICAIVPDALVIERGRFSSGSIIASHTLLNILLSEDVVVLGFLKVLSIILFGHVMGFFHLLADGPTA